MLSRRSLVFLMTGVAITLSVYSLLQRPSAHPNVLLITVDTLRADRLGCYGSTTVRTPNTDRIASEGTLFENAACPMPITRPSHFTILTSRYPADHGVTSNLASLGPDVTMVPEVFRAAGYHTGAFVGVKLLGPQSGAQRGFDIFEFPHGRRKGPTRYGNQRPAEVTVPRVLRWLDSLPKEQPFFLWVHLYDVHMPYDARTAPSAGKTGGAEAIARIDWEALAEIAGRSGGDVPRQVYDRALALYSGEVAYADHWVGALLDALRERGVLDRTVVALTADHGECFEHGIFFEHTTCLYEGAAHVPLIFRYPAGVAAGVRDRRVVEHLDIAPTLLQLAGLAVPPEFRGWPLFGRGGEERRYALLERPLTPTQRLRWSARQRAVIKTVAGEPVAAYFTRERQIALRGAEWKFLITNGREELYHLSSDPGERRNLASERADILSDLRPLAEDWITRHQLAAPDAASLTPDETEMLRSLGYLD